MSERKEVEEWEGVNEIEQTKHCTHVVFLGIEFVDQQMEDEKKNQTINKLVQLVAGTPYRMTFSDKENDFAEIVWKHAPTVDGLCFTAVTRLDDTYVKAIVRKMIKYASAVIRLSDSITIRFIVTRKL